MTRRSPGKEAELFRECLFSDQSKALIHVFFGEREVAKIPDIPKDTPTFEIKKAAVIGAGTDSFHEHVLYSSNFTLLKEGGIHQTSTFADGTSTCTYSTDIHVTDLNFVTGTGHLQYNNFSIVCV